MSTRQAGAKFQRGNSFKKTHKPEASSNTSSASLHGNNNSQYADIKVISEK